VTYIDHLRFWIEQLGVPSGELLVIFLTALIFSPLPRFIIVFSAIRLGFNGFPGKFVSLSLALALSLIQMEPVFSPIAVKVTELSKTTVSLESRQSLLKFAESQWMTFVDERTLPQFKETVDKIPVSTSALGASVGSSLGRKAVPFLLSELDRAFRMALIIILPLLVIELLVGTSLAALDLKIESELISFPLKLTLFLSTSGWSLITETLLKLG
jgi:flagellar biosynthesis protein FliP